MKRPVDTFSVALADDQSGNEFSLGRDAWRNIFTATIMKWLFRETCSWGSLNKCRTFRTVNHWPTRVCASLLCFEAGPGTRCDCRTGRLKAAIRDLCGL